ncbi:hypothetical protein POM88_032762 [Heracleum sosnowskyi]|uniref:Uncharacterized protein n=1 Tax=Heracleum sosnowskyi TaxID=360622 RepID=A0AAD8HZY8_9APIA|nr:hypothetical protein POM88_032762 [Heracleum sosnowskyi]
MCLNSTEGITLFGLGRIRLLLLMGYSKYHTRGSGINTTAREEKLEVDTVAYHLSVLKKLFPGGINVLSLFSGIGGAEVALHRLGIPLNFVVSVESSETCRNILQSWWEQSNQQGTLIHIFDVRDVTLGKLRELMDMSRDFDLVIGGNRCNNLAGRLVSRAKRVLGLLLDRTVIVVKQLSKKSKQGNREFVTEIGMISALQHPNLVKLYGCCIEGDELLLVYEYLENNSLARALFGNSAASRVMLNNLQIPERHRLELNWSTRYKVCIGIARAKLDEEDNTHISTRIAGTFGYMAPEYAMRGYLTDKQS